VIDFSRSFDRAWERMMAILFRPFDLGKWFVIGFSAFLAGLLSGGNGINGYRQTNFNTHTTYSFHSASSFHFDQRVPDFFSQMQSPFIIALVVFGFLVGLCFVVFIYWLGSRGQFLLLDNVVRNRGAISWPWQAYARQGNSLFRFYLLVLVLGLGLALPFAVVGIIMALPFFHQHRWPMGSEWPPFIIFGIFYFLILSAFSIVVFLFRELGVPLMFRHGLLAWPAFKRMWALVGAHPGPIIVFLLLRLALFVAIVVLSFLLCCVTCCVAAVPYLGTVILLPAILFIKCFTLDFLAQFGPDYDVWTVDVAPAAAPTTTGAIPSVDPTPPPPPG